MRQDRSITRDNNRISNLNRSGGPIGKIGAFLYDADFLISGGSEYERNEILNTVVRDAAAQMPVVMFHDDSIHLEAMASGAWDAATGGNAETDLFWICNGENSGFEPFVGMDDRQVVSTMKVLASKLEYTTTSRFERIVKAFLTILAEMNLPYSLSGLYYLVRESEDMNAFYDNIMALPCGQAKANQIWADLGTSDSNAMDQFDLFRAVIENLVQDAERCGWNPENIGDRNCIQAVQQGAVFLLSIDPMYSGLLMAYLAEELKAVSRQMFFLLVNDIPVSDEGLQKVLLSVSGGYVFGVVSEDVSEQVGGEEDKFQRLAARVNRIVALKHGTSVAAERVASALGKADYTRAEVSEGTSRGFFKLLPSDKRNDVRYSTENRYRIMPEVIMALREEQAIIFNADTDEIIRYN